MSENELRRERLTVSTVYAEGVLGNYREDKGHIGILDCVSEAMGRVLDIEIMGN